MKNENLIQENKYFQYKEILRELVEMQHVHVQRCCPPDILGLGEIVVEYDVRKPIWGLGLVKIPLSSLDKVAERLAKNSNIGNPGAKGRTLGNKNAMLYYFNTEDGEEYKINVTEDAFITLDPYK